MPLKEIEDFLEYYYSKYKIHFRVQVFKKEPRKWFNYKSEGYEQYTSSFGEPNHREVLPTELCLDLDFHSANASPSNMRTAQTKTISALKERMKEKGYSYSLWKSGGTGYHFHLFFDELSNYSKYEREELKRLLLRDIAYGFLTHHDDRAHVHLPVMIQVENRLSRKGRVKTIVEEVDNGKNSIPESILLKYDVEKAISRYIIKPSPLTNGEPNSIKFFLSNDFVNKDGKKRACFVLASWYAQQGLSEDETYSKLCDWNSYTLRSYLLDKHIRTTVKGVYKSNRRVSSRYRNELLKEIGAESFCE